ncbi:MAG: transposase [Desulfobacterales bacterium]|nr:transposase [Pseudomonadota bacterium]MCG2779144.1 transposase [Desulfobacterales bacterium]
MFILKNILTPLQNAFSSTNLGRDRGHLFTYTILALIIPFTSSISSNVFRCINTLFGLNVNKRRFYAFMASNKLPWGKLWRTLWNMIPDPLSDGRLLVALDDFINPKTGRKIFGCSHIFDHAAKANQSKYPWAQNVVPVGLLKRIKGRWACLPLAHRFYLPKKAIEAKLDNMKISGKDSPFQTKLDQAVEILIQLSHHFVGVPITVVCDSWFGNDGLFKPLRKHLGASVHLLSRLRSNIVLYTMPQNTTSKKRGKPRKYGDRLGTCAEMAARFISHASTHRVFLYGKYRDVNAFSKTVMLKTLKCHVRVVWVFRKTQWIALFSTDMDLSVEQIIEYYGARWKIESGFKEIKQDIGSSKSQTRNAHAVMNHINFSMMAATITWIYGTRLENIPERRHKVKGRNSFAFSDLRHIIAKTALSDDFNAVCNKEQKLPRNSFVDALLRMVR